MNIRPYIPVDYEQLATLYKQSTEFPFDEVTDAASSLQRKIERDPQSLLVVEENGNLVGSVSIIEDGRIALLFRLVANNAHENKNEILSGVVTEALRILSERGYEEVHNTAPSGNAEAEEIRNSNGFKKGKDYSWHWRKI